MEHDRKVWDRPIIEAYLTRCGLDPNHPGFRCCSESIRILLEEGGFSVSLTCCEVFRRVAEKLQVEPNGVSMRVQRCIWKGCRLSRKEFLARAWFHFVCEDADALDLEIHRCLQDLGIPIWRGGYGQVVEAMRILVEHGGFDGTLNCEKLYAQVAQRVGSLPVNVASNIRNCTQGVRRTGSVRGFLMETCCRLLPPADLLEKEIRDCLQKRDILFSQYGYREVLEAVRILVEQGGFASGLSCRELYAQTAARLGCCTNRVERSILRCVSVSPFRWSRDFLESVREEVAARQTA